MRRRRGPKEKGHRDLRGSLNFSSSVDAAAEQIQDPSHPHHTDTHAQTSLSGLIWLNIDLNDEKRF